MKSNFLLIGAIAFGIIGITDAAPRAGVGSMGGAGGGMMGGMPNTAKLGGAMAKIFGEKTTFTADMESKTTGDKAMTIPGRMSFDGGKSRTEIDMAQAKGNALPPEMAAQMKAMGMEKMIAISLPEKKINYIIYPAMEAYVEMDFSEPNSKTKSEEYKVKTPCACWVLCAFGARRVLPCRRRQMHGLIQRFSPISFSTLSPHNTHNPDFPAWSP